MNSTDIPMALPRRIGFRHGRLARILSIGLLAIISLALLAKLMSGMIGEAAVKAATAPVLTAEQRELVHLTQAAPIEADEVTARRLNADLPYDASAIEAAAPFAVSFASASERAAALKCLAQAVYYEAGFEPLSGRRAVAQVVLNRARHPAFANSVCGVVYEGHLRPVCQFSFVCDGSLGRAPERGAWVAAERIAAEALNGHVEAAVGTSTHYHADYVYPRWAPRLTKLSQIGAHIFYTWPGGWGRPQAFTARYAGREYVPAWQKPELQQTDGMEAPQPDPVVAGPPERRAENDVGGRLDVSKGWTLQIPLPSASGMALAGAVGRQTGEAAAARPLAVADAALKQESAME